MRNDHPSRELVICLILSVMLHAGIGFGLLNTNGLSLGPHAHAAPRSPDEPEIPMVQLSQPPEQEQPPPPPPPREEQHIQLGEEDSDAVTMTWLGFKDYLPNAADKGEVEQAALQRDPSAGGRAIPAIPAVDPAALAHATTPPAPPPSPPITPPPPAPRTVTEEAESAPPPPPPNHPQPVAISTAEPAASAEGADEAPEHKPAKDADFVEGKNPSDDPAPPVDDPAPPDEKPPDDTPPNDTPPDAPPPDPTDPADQKEKQIKDHPEDPRDQIAPEDRIPPQEQTPEPQDQQQPTPPDANSQPAPPSSPQEPVPGGEGNAQGPGSSTDSNAQGIADDRESDASSIEQMAIRELGKPLAARGLRISTVKPRFSYHTQVMGWGIDPVVRISFASDGTVREVVFLQESGNPDIDRPVKDALFAWRAEGKALASLGDPRTGETIAVDVRILK